MTNFGENISVYDIISVLAKCFYNQATVHLAKHSPSGQIVAIKRFHLEKMIDNIQLVENEIILTRQLKHPNILSYYATFVHGPEVFVISPLQAFGSCKSLLNTHFNEGLPELAIILILRDILKAVNYLHKTGFIHRAIRASHILISGNGTACLTGLRYACPIVDNGKWQKNIHSFPLSIQPNLSWLSPELLEQDLRGYNEKSDIYSLGIVCCELANGKEPFGDLDSTLMLVEKLRGWSPQLLDSSTILLSNEYRDCDAQNILSKKKFSQCLHGFSYVCLLKEPNDRPNTNELLTHPVFKLIRKGVSLSELLKPALPFDDNMAYNEDEIADVEHIGEFPDIDTSPYNWDFSSDKVS